MRHMRVLFIDPPSYPPPRRGEGTLFSRTAPRIALPLVAMLVAASWTRADEAPATGHVQIPVDVYNHLVEAAKDPTRAARRAPTGYALGNARVSLTVRGAGPRTSGEVSAELTIDVLEDQWVLVPVLPAGTPVDGATVGGEPVQLVATPSGLGWAT